MTNLQWLSLSLVVLAITILPLFYGLQAYRKLRDYNTEIKVIDSTLKKRESDYLYLIIEHNKLVDSLHKRLHVLDSVERNIQTLDPKTWKKYYGHLPYYPAH